jgi:hypothetical protein
MVGHGDDAEFGEEGDPGWLDPRAGVELAVGQLPVRVLGGAGGELLDFAGSSQRGWRARLRGGSAVPDAVAV